MKAANPQEPKRILLVSSDERDRRDAERALGAAVGMNLDVVWSRSYDDAVDEVMSRKHAVVLVHEELEGGRGLDLIRDIRGSGFRRPVILLSRRTGRQIDVDALRAGASDCITGDRRTPDLLEHSLRYALERHRLEERLRRRSKRQMRVKQEFLSHVSHELRSPLTVIYMLVTLILDGLAGRTSAKQKEYLGIALRNIEQLRDMIEDLMEVTRAETGKLLVRPRVVSLRDLIRSTVEELRPKAQSKGLTLETELPDVLPPVYADTDRVRQILSNLIENAVKFTPAGGRIAATVRGFEKDPQFLRISVSDTGIGIKTENHGKVFGRLKQVDDLETGPKGLGLGLYICKELVARHHGAIWLESEPREGSVFHFTLPIFSMTRFLSEEFAGRSEDLRSASLVTVRIYRPDADPRPLPEKALWDVWSVLQGCLRAHKDILLPRLVDDDPTEHLFLLSARQRGSVDRLVHRIDRDLARLPSLPSQGLDWEVSSNPLALSEVPGAETAEMLVLEAGDAVQKLIRRIRKEGRAPVPPEQDLDIG